MFHVNLPGCICIFCGFYEVCDESVCVCVCVKSALLFSIVFIICRDFMSLRTSLEKDFPVFPSKKQGGSFFLMPKLTASVCVFSCAGTPSVLFFEATLPLKPATIALQIWHLAFQGV